MSPRNEPARAWHPVPLSAIQDDDLLRVPPAARWLFFGMVFVAAAQRSNGRVGARQATSCVPGVSRVGTLLRQLCDAELLTFEHAEDAYYINDVEKWGLPGPKPVATVSQPRQNSVSTGRKAAGHSVASGNVDEPSRPQRKKETEKERENVPIPSGIGSERSPSRAAPRSAESAAQHAPDRDVPAGDDGRRLSRQEIIAKARSEIQKGRAKNPGATGRDTSFSKYDPDRPMTPINSAIVSQQVSE